MVQWGTQKGETCGDIANALYGSPKYAHLLLRYNRISCAAPLAEGLTLVAPAKVNSLPTARLKSMHPDVQTRPPAGGWQAGSSGQSLGANYNVKTQDQGRADIEFVDRTRVFLAPHTLVVIFDTAAQSKVSKATPPRVEVQEGEVRAGLAALRGDAIEVAVTGGGQVSAASRDTVIARKGERTTVAVFDGKAGVKSGGKSVEVPTNFGTRFVGKQPPAPPRPLPPPPVWLAQTTPQIGLGLTGQLDASWQPVPDALSYRVEVAREADFGAPLVREEVPGSVTSFRAEKLPPGKYFFRVRAIDKDEYLGIAATRSATLVVAALKNARLEGGRLVLRGGSSVELQAPPGVEVAADDGAFGPVPPSLALSSPPRRLRLRPDASGSIIDIPVEVDALRGQVTTQPEAGGKLRVLFSAEGRTADEALAEGHPQARVTVGERVVTAPLERVDERLLGALIDQAPGETMRIDVLDDRGASLGSSSFQAERPPVRVIPERPVPPVLGVVAPVWAHHPDAAPLWRSPRATSGAAVAALAIPGDQAGYQLDARGSGVIRNVGVDLALRSRLAGDVATDGTAWAGLRVPVHVARDHGFEVGAMLHGSFPTTPTSPSPALEPALALGGKQGALSWVVDLGGRVRLSDNSDRAATARGQGFVVAGVAVRPAPWLRLYLALDGRALAAPASGEALRGGGAVGAEAGTRWFVGVGARGGLGEPSGQGAFTTQLTLGLRERFL